MSWWGRQGRAPSHPANSPGLFPFWAGGVPGYFKGGWCSLGLPCVYLGFQYFPWHAPRWSLNVRSQAREKMTALPLTSLRAKFHGMGGGLGVAPYLYLREWGSHTGSHEGTLYSGKGKLTVHPCDRPVVTEPRSTLSGAKVLWALNVPLWPGCAPSSDPRLRGPVSRFLWEAPAPLATHQELPEKSLSVWKLCKESPSSWGPLVLGAQ